MDGIIDAALLMVYEGRFRPAEMRVDRFVDWQRDKIIRALQSIEPAPMPRGAGCRRYWSCLCAGLSGFPQAAVLA